MTRRQFVASALATGALASLPGLAQERVTEVRLSFRDAASKAVPPDYLGFSYETSQLADPSFFAADNKELVSPFQMLTTDGILRLGGHLPGEQLAPEAAAVAAEGSFYTPIAGSRENGFSARPVFYGMKLAGILAGGRIRPAQFNASTANAAAWAAEMPGGATRLILLNKDVQQRLEISIPSAYDAKLWRLQAPGLTATSDVTLAGAAKCRKQTKAMFVCDVKSRKAILTIALSLLRATWGGSRFPAAMMFLAVSAVATGAEFFDGVDAASQPVMAAARRRIDDIRKGNFTLRLVGPEGAPVRGKATVRLLRHEFQFGANLSGFGNALPEGSPLRAKALQAVEDLFAAVELQNSWQNTEPVMGGPMVWTKTDTQVAWARARQMPIRFHCLIYDFHYAIPKWSGEVKSTEAWWPLIERRIRTTAERYGEAIGEFNVINEMIMNAAWEKKNNPLFPALWNPTNGARMFRLARQYLPHAKLVSCEGRFAGASVSRSEFQEQYDYNQTLLQLGAPVDVIGYQGHFFALGNVPYQKGTPATPGAFTMKVIDEGFDRLAGLGKPIHITEFTPPARSQGRPASQPGLTGEEVAAWASNFYTVAFSKPCIDQVIWWQVLDGYGGRATDAGVLDKEGNPKPTYTALRRLIAQEWHTGWKGDVAEGAVSFRGFFGLYEVRVNGFQPARVWMRTKEKNETVVKFQPEQGMK